MPFLRKGQPLPVKGINLAVPSTFLPEAYHFPENMHYNRGEITKRHGKTKFGGQLTGAARVQYLAVAEASISTQTLFAHTPTRLHRYDTATGTFVDIQGNYNDLTGSDADYYDHAVVAEDDLYVYTNYKDPIKKWDLLSGVNPSSLGGSPPKARYVEYITPYLVLANVEESGSAIPTKIRWSNTGDVENFTTGNAGSQLLTHEPSAIRGILKMRNYVMCYKEKSVYRGRLVSTSSIFDFGDPYYMGYGLYAPRALVNAEGIHYYMGTDDFYYNDGVRIVPFGGLIREHVFNRLNRSKWKTCFALAVEEYKEVWFFITVSSDDNPTEVWKYRYDLGFWYKDTLEQTILCATNYKVVQDLAWDDIDTPWDQYIGRWDDSIGQADSPLQMFGTDDGHVLKRDSSVGDDDFEEVVCSLQTKDYSGIDVGGSEFDVRWLQLNFWAYGDSIQIYYSIDYGSNWTYIGEQELTGQAKRYTKFFDVDAPHIRFKFENRDANETFTLRSFTPFYVQREDSPI